MTKKTEDLTLDRQKYHQNIMDKISIESSSVDTCRPAGEKQLYVEKLEQQVESLKAIIDDMTEKSKYLEEELRSKFNKDRNRIENGYRKVVERIGDIRSSGGDAWKELGKGTSNALEDFMDGLNSAISKFK